LNLAESFKLKFEHILDNVLRKPPLDPVNAVGLRANSPAYLIEREDYRGSTVDAQTDAPSQPGDQKARY
jgi:hypothetical protein